MTLSVETVSSTILLFNYTKALPNRNKLKSFIVPIMKYLIMFLDNNGKSADYTRGNIHGLYSYI